MDILKYCSELDSIMSESPKKKKLLKESSVKKPVKNSQKNRRINENYGNDGYMYLTKHGLGPGTLPKDVHLLKAKDLPHYMTAIWLDRFLTTDELKKFDIYPETEIRRVMDFYDISEKDLLDEAYVNPETGKDINNVYGMTNIEIEVEDENRIVVYADTKRFGKHEIMAECNCFRDAFDYVKRELGCNKLDYTTMMAVGAYTDRNGETFPTEMWNVRPAAGSMEESLKKKPLKKSTYLCSWYDPEFDQYIQTSLRGDESSIRDRLEKLGYQDIEIEKEIDFDSDSNLDFSEITKHRFLTDESLTEDEEVEYVKKYGREMVPDGTHRISYYEFEQPKHPKDWHLGQRNRREISADEYNELAFGVKKQKNEALKEKPLKELTRKEMYSKAFDSISKSIEKTGGINFWDMNEIMDMVNKWNDSHPKEREIEIYEGDDYVQIDDEPIYVNQLVSESCKTKKNRKKSLKEKLVDAPQEVVDRLLEILEKYGFVLDPEIKHENPIRSRLFGNVHIQVYYPEAHVDPNDELEIEDTLSTLISRNMIDEIDRLDEETNCPITWNFGVDNKGRITGGLDIMKQYIDESVSRRKKRPLKEDSNKYIDKIIVELDDEDGDCAYEVRGNKLHNKYGFYQGVIILEDDESQGRLKKLGIKPGDEFVVGIRKPTPEEQEMYDDAMDDTFYMTDILYRYNESLKRENKRSLKEAKDRWIQTPYGFKELNYKGITITDYKDCEIMFMPYRYTVDYYGDEAGFDSLDDAKKDIDEFLSESENN